MADLDSEDLLNLSFYNNKPYPLEQIDDVVSDKEDRSGGFTNIMKLLYRCGYPAIAGGPSYYFPINYRKPT